jgi:hypothetical protein
MAGRQTQILTCERCGDTFTHDDVIKWCEPCRERVHLEVLKKLGYTTKRQKPRQQTNEKPTYHHIPSRVEGSARAGHAAQPVEGLNVVHDVPVPPAHMIEIARKYELGGIPPLNLRRSYAEEN